MTIGDQPLGIAPRAMARARHDLGDALAFIGTCLDRLRHPGPSGMVTGRIEAPMMIALAEAEAAASRGEVPVGCVITDAAGVVLARQGNRTLELRDPTAHAELLAIRAACQALGTERLVACDIHVTLEPCAMCAAAISFARLRRLYFAAGDPKMGAVEHGPHFFTQATCHHRPEIYGGIAEAPAQALLKHFFAARR